MKMTLLLLLLLRVLQTSALSHASVIVSPNRSQHFEYKTVSLSCEQFGSGDWTVWRYTTNNLVLSQCGSGWGSQTSSTCEITAVKKTDTGVYWCESKHRDSSRTVNITVTGGSVILESPVLPVMEGHNVPLSCKTRQDYSEDPTTPSSDPTATFSNDSTTLRTGRSGHMTISNFSRSDEGLYRCNRNSDGESPASWISVADDSEPASLTVLPDSAQLFEYATLTLNCGDDSGSRGWKVIRATTSTDKMIMQTCGDKWGATTDSGCFIHTTKKPDSAIYWCESPARQRSNSVSITVYGSSTSILRSPVLPVMKGDNVTLTCEKKPPPSTLLTAFYKDNVLIRTERTDRMILYRVSKADEGIYWCNISGHGASPPSWLFVRDPDGEASSLSAETRSAFRLLCHLLVFCPYCISTVLMVSICRHRRTGRKPPEDDVGLDQPYDDVIADVTTEHHF